MTEVSIPASIARKQEKRMYSKENSNPEIIASDRVLNLFFNVHFKMIWYESGKCNLPCFVKLLFSPGNLAEKLESLE